MVTEIIKVRGGAIALPEKLRRDWRDADVFLRFSDDTLVVKKVKKPEIFGIGKQEKVTRQPQTFKTFKPTKAELKALKRARENYKNGNYLTLNEFERKLGFTN